MTFTPASAGSVIAFLCVVAFVIAAFLVGVHRSAAAGSNRTARTARTARVAAGVAFWLALVSAVVATRVLEAAPMPRLMIFLAACNLVALGVALSPLGGQLAATLPLTALVGFQAFRLPLELVLHSWVAQGTIPGTMTWEGRNLDVISGVAALLCAPLARRHRGAAWAANVIGFVLLLNVGRVAAMSSPLPFAWHVEPPLQLAFHLPYAWIVPVCVAGALAGHVVLTRALLLRAPA